MKKQPAGKEWKSSNFAQFGNILFITTIIRIFEHFWR